MDDIFDVYKADLAERNRRHAENYPYGDLEYVQDKENPNLYWAQLPAPKPIHLDNLFEVPIGDVYDCNAVHTLYPKLKGDLVLYAIVEQTNQLLAGIPRPPRPEKIAFQEWEKIFINSEPQFRAKNWIADGPRMTSTVQPVLIDLATEKVRFLETQVEFESAGGLSDLALSLLETLLKHQVKGDQIIQGLKSYAEQHYMSETFTQFKLVENYLGFWQVRGNCNTVLTVSEFIGYVNRAQ